MPRPTGPSRTSSTTTSSDDARKTLDDVFNKKRAELGDDDALVARYNRIDDALRNDMDTLIAVGTKHWKAIKDDIRNLRFDLAKAQKS